MEVRILTDTASDLSPAEVESLNVDLIELPVTLDGEEISWKELDLFWQKLIAGKLARTSQQSPEVYRAKFEEAKKGGYALVCILISSNMSGSYESAVAIKEEVGYDNIFVVDSLNASTTEMIMVREACRLRDEGATPEEIVEHVEKLKHRVKIFACLDTLKYVARGGRISKTAAAIGNLINLKPVITFVDGYVTTAGKAFGITQGANKLLDKMREIPADPTFGYIPIYPDNSKNTMNFIQRAKANGFDVDENRLTPIGATIGTHIGPNAFGIVFVAKE
ncbi:MAG: DegV family protein [Clostridiales bacterium]|nr:DegV family protein [Clostridiales bacterium]